MLENNPLKERRKKYFASGAEVYKIERDGSEKQLIHSTKSTVRNTVVAVLNEEYYNGLNKRIDMLNTTSTKIQEAINYTYKTLKPVIANGGELGDNAYKIIIMLDTIKRALVNAEQVLRQKINN